MTPASDRFEDSETEIEELTRLRSTPDIFERLSQLRGSELSIQAKLREQFDPHLVRAAITLNVLRSKAARILPAGEQLWLTRVGLEQASAWAVAQHKAARFASGSEILDLCSGIGVDCAALLSRGAVTAIDRDSAMLRRCEWNLDVWRQAGVLSGRSAFRPESADVRDRDFSGKLIHIDPDRRDGKHRPVRRLEQYCPDLDWMRKTIASAEGGALKLGPASNFIQKFSGCQTELISLNGECREATVWFGCLAQPEAYRATVLPGGESIAADPLSAICGLASDLGAFLFDPDPAVVRAGLVDAVGEIHKMERLDNSDEYLTGNTMPKTDFVRSFCVQKLLPNNVKELKRYLRPRAAQQYEVKCRQLHVDANAIQKTLPRGDGPPLVIFFVRMQSKARIVVAERASYPAEP